MRRGEIRWGGAVLPGGSRKRRPFLIVSDDAFNLNERYTKVMVVHLTSVRRIGGPYDWEADLPRGTADLDRSSVAKCGEVYTLLKEQLGERTGTVPAERMRHVDRALAAALGLRLADELRPPPPTRRKREGAFPTFAVAKHSAPLTLEMVRAALADGSR